MNDYGTNLYDFINAKEETDNMLIHFAPFVYDDPISFEEASHDEKWWKTMQEEVSLIEKDQICQLVDLP